MTEPDKTIVFHTVPDRVPNPGDTIPVLDNNGTRIGTATANADGTYTYSRYTEDDE